MPQGRMSPRAHGDGMSRISFLKLHSGYEENSHHKTTATVYLLLLHRVWYMTVPGAHAMRLVAHSVKQKGLG